MNVELKPISRHDLRPIREIVFLELKNAIFEGRIKEGEHLVESIIAKKMDVSRTPVREALRQLESEGLVINVPRKGAVVKGITKEDASEIYDLREVLEGLVAKLACENIEDSDIDRLKNILELMERAINHKDHGGYLELHNDYNNIILNNCHNKRLQLMMNNIYEYLISLRRVSLYTEDRRAIAMEEHKQIVYALEKRDGEKAEDLTRAHVRKAKVAFFDNLIEENS